MRERIEAGETAHVFASANMAHPRMMEAAGRGGPVALFARNRLCALTSPDLQMTSAGLLEMMLSEDVRLGMSTPVADPSGDYALALFDRAEAVRPGAAEVLRGKAVQLTGGPDSPRPPEGRNTHAWVMDDGQAQIVIWNICLPRVGAAILVGAALAAAGASYQALFRNPLVSPDILGVSAGAGLGAVVGIFLSLPVVMIQAAAFAGGLGAVALVMIVASAVRNTDRTLSLVLWSSGRLPGQRLRSSRCWPIPTTSSPRSPSGCSARSPP